MAARDMMQRDLIVGPAPPRDEAGHTWHRPDQVLFQYTGLAGREALARQGVAVGGDVPGFGDAVVPRAVDAYRLSSYDARETDQ